MSDRTRRKYDEGFSLVELIVVVLIMAIIAIALAPQIMKWVGNSRTSTDANMYDTMVEDLQLALTKESVLDDIKNGNDDEERVIITINNQADGEGHYTVLSGPAADSSGIREKLGEICGSEWQKNVKAKAKTSGYVIAVLGNGTIRKGGAAADSIPVHDDYNS